MERTQMETQISELCAEEGIKEFLFIGIKEDDNTIVSLFPGSTVSAFGLLKLAEKSVENNYYEATRGSGWN